MRTDHAQVLSATHHTMTRLCHILCLLAFCIGCEREPAPAPTLNPKLAAFLAEGRSNAIADHLTNGMSDEQILRAIGYDPATLRSNRGGNGIDAYDVEYISDMTDITITRSLSTGITVLRYLPKDQQKQWVLER